MRASYILPPAKRKIDVDQRVSCYLSFVHLVSLVPTVLGLSLISSACTSSGGDINTGGAGGAAGMDGIAGAGGKGGDGGAGSDACRGPLEEYCSPCATYDQAFAVAFEGYEVCSGDGQSNTLPAAGTCGELRWIVTWDTLDEYVEYFDSVGTMVGATVTMDVFVLCDGSSSTKHYGLVPDCDRMTTARACEPQ